MNKTLELLIVIANLIFGGGLLVIAVSGDVNALLLGRFFLGVIGLGAVCVGVGLLLNWIDTWIY